MGDPCGFICKLKKGGSTVTSFVDRQVQKERVRRDTKTMQSLGYNPKNTGDYMNFQKARATARTKAKQKADTEKRSSWIANLEHDEYCKQGGTKGCGPKSQGIGGIDGAFAKFDSFMGVKPTPKKRKSTKKSKSKQKYVVINGKKYTETQWYGKKINKKRPVTKPKKKTKTSRPSYKSFF